MFRVGDKVKVGNGKVGTITALHEMTTYNGVAKGYATLGEITYPNGKKIRVNDMYRSDNPINKVK